MEKWIVKFATVDHTFLDSFTMHDISTTVVLMVLPALHIFHHSQDYNQLILVASFPDYDQYGCSLTVAWEWG